MTEENWDALLDAMRRGGGVSMSDIETKAVLRELELLREGGFLHTDAPVKKLERAT